MESPRIGIVAGGRRIIDLSYPPIIVGVRGGPDIAGRRPIVEATALQPAQHLFGIVAKFQPQIVHEA